MKRHAEFSGLGADTVLSQEEMGTSTVFNFPSLASLLNRAENGKSTSTYGRQSRKSDYDDEWTNGSWATCLESGKKGWADGAKRIRELSQPLLDKISSQMYKPEMYATIEGGTIDMGTYMTGDPDCFMVWRDSEELAENTGEIVRVIISGAMSGGYSSEQLFRKGAAVAAVVDALEMAGKRVSLEYECTVSKRYGAGARITTRVPVKEPGEPVDMENIAFVLAHAGMLRRVMFSFWETLPLETVQSYGFYRGAGYSYPGDMPENERVGVDIYVGSTMYDMMRNPLEWARRELERQGVTFQDK